MERLEEKWKALQSNLRQRGRLAVAFSGGVDSAFLLWAARQVLGDDAVGVTVLGDMVPPAEQADAKGFTVRFGIAHHSISVDVFRLPEFVENSPERCYFCKKFLFSKIAAFAEAHRMTVVEGSNVDDIADYRPGRKALQELGVGSPLLEAGLTKAEIRELSHRYGLPTWNKPACACLASRVPYGTTITPRMLRQVGEAEAFLHSLGFDQLRVRHHGGIARIEVSAEDFPRLLTQRAQINTGIRQLGFDYVTVDLEPYRTGRLNDALHQKKNLVDKP